MVSDTWNSKQPVLNGWSFGHFQAFSNHQDLETSQVTRYLLQKCVVFSGIRFFAPSKRTEMENRLRSLFKHLSNHPSATIDIVFWSELAGEDVSSSMPMQDGCRGCVH